MASVGENNGEQQTITVARKQFTRALGRSVDCCTVICGFSQCRLDYVVDIVIGYLSHTILAMTILIRVRGKFSGWVQFSICLMGNTHTTH